MLYLRAFRRIWIGASRAIFVPSGFLPIRPPDLIEDITFTPLGGMVMDKACDLYGRVQGYPRMYVMDSSLLPGSCATANPSLTIAALAERNIQTILTEDLISTEI